MECPKETGRISTRGWEQGALVRVAKAAWSCLAFSDCPCLHIEDGEDEEQSPTALNQVLAYALMFFCFEMST